MTKQKIEIRVGVFVFIGLIILAILLLSFSKGTLFMKPTYEILLKTRNVGGIKTRAGVLMSGVQVGHVDKVYLTSDNMDVIIQLKIEDKYKIRKDSRFVIEQAGFLGDQYVAIYPSTNQTPYLNSGDIVACEEPFNLQETARAAARFIKTVEDSIQDLNKIIMRLDTNLFTEQNFANINYSVSNLNKITENLVSGLEQINSILLTNKDNVTLTISNVTQLSSNLVPFITELNSTVLSVHRAFSTNEERIAITLSNLVAATADATNLLAKLQTGEGLIPALIGDREIKNEVTNILENVSQLSANITIATSNLNKHGLWWMLWKPKYPKTNVTQTVQKSEVKVQPPNIPTVPKRQF